MLLLIIITLILSFSSTLILSSRPLFIGIWIILITIFLRLIANIITIRWLGLIMLLIYIGGLLVIFSYFVALTPNLIIEGKSIIKNITYSIPVVIILLYNFINTDQKTLSLSSSRPIRYLFIEHFTIIFILALILLFALVATVKIVSIYSSPLRPFN